MILNFFYSCSKLKSAVSILSLSLSNLTTIYNAFSYQNNQQDWTDERPDHTVFCRQPTAEKNSDLIIEQKDFSKLQQHIGRLRQ